MGFSLNFKYGDFWEKYPIEAGELWAVGEHRFFVSDVENPDTYLGALKLLPKIDVMFIDPLWNNSHAKGFLTKANFERRTTMATLWDHVLELIARIGPSTIYLEMGFQWVDRVQEDLEGLLRSPASRYNVRYGRSTTYTSAQAKHPCYLLRLSSSGSVAPPLEGLDDMTATRKALSWEAKNGAEVVFDCCAGRGLTAKAATECGMTSINMELNKRRLANAISKVVSFYGRTAEISQQEVGNAI